MWSSVHGWIQTLRAWSMNHLPDFVDWTGTIHYPRQLRTSRIVTHLTYLRGAFPGWPGGQPLHLSIVAITARLDQELEREYSCILIYTTSLFPSLGRTFFPRVIYSTPQARFTHRLPDSAHFTDLPFSVLPSSMSDDALRFPLT